MRCWELRAPRRTSPTQAGAGGDCWGRDPSRQLPCRGGGLRPLHPCSPVLQPLLRVLQASFQVPDADLLLLQGCQILLRRRWLYPMVVTAEVVLGRAPAGTQASPTRQCWCRHGLGRGAPREMGTRGCSPTVHPKGAPRAGGAGWVSQGAVPLAGGWVQLPDPLVLPAAAEPSAELQASPEQRVHEQSREQAGTEVSACPERAFQGMRDADGEPRVGSAPSEMEGEDG